MDINTSRGIDEIVYIGTKRTHLMQHVKQFKFTFSYL